MWLAAVALSLGLAPPPEPSAISMKHDVVPGIGAGLRVDSFTLANGLRVHVQEDHSSPSFTLVVAYDVGARDEPTGRTGFAHLFEHMMFEGSANVGPGDHSRHIIATGGERTAFTTHDATFYIDVLPSHELDLALFLEADRMRSLAITAQNLDNQRNIVKEEKATRFDSIAYANAFIDFFADVWAGTGYGHTKIGSEADLSAASVDDVKAFFAQHYSPKNAVLVVSGDVEAAVVRDRVQAWFGEIPAGSRRAAIAAVDHTQKKFERRVVDPLAPQAAVVVGWKTVAHDHPDRPALDLLGDILWEGRSARIQKRIDELGIALPVRVDGGTLGGGRDAGTMLVGFILHRADVRTTVVDVVRQQIAAIRSRGPTAKELAKAKNGRAMAFLQTLATNTDRALLIAEGALCCGDPTRELDVLRRLRAVRPADIRRVAQRYLTETWLLLDVVPPS